MSPTDFARRVFAPVAVQDRNNKVLSVDLAAFVTRLLLFDTYILQSVWLEDLILLQHSCGTHGLAELFESGALKFQTAGFTFGQIGQAKQTLNPATPPLPLFSYQFSVLRVRDAEQRVERTIAALDAPLRVELVKGRVVEPADYSATVFDVFYRDLKSGLLDDAVIAELRRRGIIPIAHQIHAEQKAEDEFAVENDLSRRYLLPQSEAHRIIEAGMIGSPRLNSEKRRVSHPTVFRVRILIFSWLDFCFSIPRGSFLALRRLFPRSFVVAGLQPGSFSRHSPLATSLALPHPTSYNRLFASAARKQSVRT